MSLDVSVRSVRHMSDTTTHAHTFSIFLDKDFIWYNISCNNSSIDAYVTDSSPFEVTYTTQEPRVVGWGTPRTDYVDISSAQQLVVNVCPFRRSLSTAVRRLTSTSRGRGWGSRCPLLQCRRRNSTYCKQQPYCLVRRGTSASYELPHSSLITFKILLSVKCPSVPGYL